MTVIHEYKYYIIWLLGFEKYTYHIVIVFHHIYEPIIFIKIKVLKAVNPIYAVPFITIFDII